jgi:ribosomal protein S18 acetylase RimI-like enzyme
MAFRGRGIGLAIVLAIEASARREGVETMRLETGIKSGEARRLYGRLGCRERGPFGDYLHDELSVFMEKELC